MMYMSHMLSVNRSYFQSDTWFSEKMIYASVSLVRKSVYHCLEVVSLESDILGSNSHLVIN